MIKGFQRNFLSCLILAIITLLIFAPVRHFDFTNWDDKVYVTENPLITNLSANNLKRILTTPTSGVYSPLTILSFAVEYHFVGLKASIYHLTNLFLHISVGLLIYMFALSLSLPWLGSFLAALIFLVHPVHVESVAWVTERKDVLYAFFYMLTLVSYVRYTQDKKVKFFIFSVICGILSMLAKPMALSLPLILGLIDWFLNRSYSKRIVVEKIVHFLYIIPLAWVTYSLHARVPGQNIVEGALIWIYSFSFYLQKFFIPFNFSPKYELSEPFVLTNPAYLIAVLIFVAVLAGIYFFRRNRWVIFSVAWYFLSIFFLLRLDNNADFTIVSDRFMYLPCLGFCLLLGGLIAQQKNKIGAYGFSFIVFVWLVVQTRTILPIWQNSVTLWSYVIEKLPNLAVAYNNRGEAYSQKGLYDLAIADYKKVLAFDKAHVSTYNNLADAFSAKGRDELALVQLNRSLELDTTYQALYNRANIYLKSGKLNEAMEDYNKAIELNPHLPQAFNNRGLIYLSRKEWKEAKENFDQALNLSPQFYDSLNNRAFTSLNTGEFDRAIEDASLAIKIKPDDYSAYFNRGNALRMKKLYPQAVLDYNRVIEFNPQFAAGYVNRSLCFFELRNYSAALNDALQAKKLGIQGIDSYLNQLQDLMKTGKL